MPTNRQSAEPVDVHIVGTAHSIQLARPGVLRTQSASFADYLAQLCRENGIVAIAEEMSEDGMAMAEVNVTVPMRVAQDLGLAHRLCDPGQAQRTLLDMDADENSTRIHGWLNDWTEKLIEEKVARDIQTRERLWLERIKELDHWPLLFVCGATHSLSFAQRVKTLGRRVDIAAIDWGS